MSTTTPLTDSITALTTYANEITGGSDTTLSEAVATLVAGYGGSSGGVTFSAISVTFQNDASKTIGINRLLYSHDGSPLFGFARSNVTAGSSITTSNMATDGTHIFFNPGCNLSSITYNDSSVTFVISSTDIELTLPSDYDSSIPFVLII